MTDIGRIVYVTEPGAIVRREGRVLIVRARKQELGRVQADKLEQLVLVGEITLTPRAIDLLVDAGVDTVLLSGTGRFRARIASSTSRQVQLRLSQYATLSIPDGRLGVARAVVAGKLHNQRGLLLRHARRHDAADVVRPAVVALRLLGERAEHETTLESLSGLEGAGAAAYFRVFGSLLRNPAFSFEGRNRRPPIDPVNALLSLGYTLLMTAMEGTVHAVGLDPYLGALHAPQNGRASLVCDLIEELRAPVIDQLVVAAINRGAFSRDDFEEVGEGEPVIIRPAALRWFVTLFERRMQKTTAYEGHGQLRWRDVMLQQCRCLVRVFREGSVYEPYRMR